MTARPTTPAPDYTTIPDDLKRVPRWVCWRFENKGGDWAKIPICPSTGRWASSTDPSTWAAFEIAVDACERLAPRPDGIGIVFTDDDNLIGIDLDDCIGDDGELIGEAAEIVASMRTYTEVSPSGRGVKLFGRGDFTRSGIKRPRQWDATHAGGVEIYGRGRYFTVTGRRIGEHASIGHLNGALDRLIGEPARPSTTPRAAMHGEMTQYARAALEREAGAVLAAPGGMRNDTLNKASFNLGTLTGAGELDRGDAENTLLSAALACGLGEHEARGTIRSGLNSGEQHPRVLAKPSTRSAPTSTDAVEIHHENPSALLNIRALRELGPSAPPNWIWPGYIARGGITLFTGLWKCGKSTLLAHLLRDIRRGGGLVDEPTDCGVIVLSEEPAGLWANRRDDLDLDPEIRIAHRHTLARPTGPEWTRIIGEIVREIEKGTYGLVVIDTLASWWPVLNENDAGEMGEALAPLRAISNAGAGLLLCHHPRKGDGQHATATRGSGALPGFVDLIVELRRYATDDGDPDTRRRLTAYGRFEGVPDERIIDLGPDGYTIVGGVAEARADDIRATIAEILPDDGPGMTLEEVRDNWPGTPPGKNRVRAMLNEGANHERWGRSGTGVKGDPIRFGPLGRGPAESNPSPPMRGESGRIFDSAYPHP